MTGLADWFHSDIDADYGIAALSPDCRRIAVLAATDLDETATSFVCRFLRSVLCCSARCLGPAPTSAARRSG
ncbi:DUF6183 family protein [Streptomyces sp. NPDC090798]|uniref:DUF6183 family protein n=1 Tax=Streptomyces sp. NPDC090798 TaxID=3365968 RepID=UPI0037FEE693